MGRKHLQNLCISGTKFCDEAKVCVLVLIICSDFYFFYHHSFCDSQTRLQNFKQHCTNAQLPFPRNECTALIKVIGFEFKNIFTIQDQLWLTYFQFKTCILRCTNGAYGWQEGRSWGENLLYTNPIFFPLQSRINPKFSVFD